MAVKPATRADDDKLMSALQRLCDEDPSLTVPADDETHQTILGVSGEVHLAVSMERLDRKCNVHVEREDLRIPYRETITAAGPGRGQAQEAVGRARPVRRRATSGSSRCRRGEGFAFHDAVVGGAIPRQYIPAVEKGVLETFASRRHPRLPHRRLAVTVDDGKAHSVDSNEVSFKMAAALAVRQAMSEAGPILLEPISRLEVTIPAECQGDVLGDLHSRRARIIGTDPADDGLPDGHRHGADGRAHPLRGGPACADRGRGSSPSTYDHYDAVPEHLDGLDPRLEN